MGDYPMGDSRKPRGAGIRRRQRAQGRATYPTADEHDVLAAAVETIADLVHRMKKLMAHTARMPIPPSHVGNTADPAAHVRCPACERLLVEESWPDSEGA